MGGGVTSFGWEDLCESCKGYETASECFCPSPTSPERPSNKPPTWWALQVTTGPLAGLWVSPQGGFVARDDRALYASERAARRAAADALCEGITIPYEVEDRPQWVAGGLYQGGSTVKEPSQPLKLEVADPVNHPPHYTQGGIETIDAIEAALTAEEFRGYCKGNALKYVWRERHKGQNESIKKAIWYLNRLVDE